VLTMISALPVGPYDWNPSLLPEAEYETRLALARERMSKLGLSALIVHGDRLDEGALAWLSGMIPKLGPAFALVGASGPVRVLFSGGAGMRSSAARQTWIEDVRAIGSLESDLVAWLEETGKGPERRVGLWDGEALSMRARRAITRAGHGRARMEEVGDSFEALRRRKSQFELGLMETAGALARAVLQRCDEGLRAGQGMRRAALAAERAGYDAGAQDVRVLGSRRPSGVPLVIDGAEEARASEANLYVAVRYRGYWSDLHGRSGEADDLSRLATEGLRAAAARSCPGMGLDEIAGSGGLRPQLHIDLAGIGLSLREAPLPGQADRLEEGDVCSITVTARGSGRCASASDVFVIARTGAISLSEAGMNERKSELRGRS